MTKQELDDLNAKMLEAYGYTYTDCVKLCSKLDKEPMAEPYGSYVVASRKKKGAGKGYKTTYRWEWRDYRGWRKELAESRPKEYALLLCSEELATFEDDTMRWNDRRAQANDYRRAIAKIRKEYGLTSNDVARFMRVKVD